MFTKIGTGGNDVLTGGNDNDALDGLAGADTMSGGAGNDIYFVDQAGDVVTELLDKGTQDTIVSMITLTLPANVENLQLVGGALNGTGNGLDNDILGNSLANSLDGGAGNDFAGRIRRQRHPEGRQRQRLPDRRRGHQPATGRRRQRLPRRHGRPKHAGRRHRRRHLYRRRANDIVSEAAGGGIDRIISSISFDLSVNGAEVEKLSLSGSTDLGGIGNALNNIIDGGNGNDVLFGGDRQ